MIWEVSDEGHIRVILRTKMSSLVKSPQVMMHEYLQGVTADFVRVGLELLRDSYRLRLHKNRDLVEIFWDAWVPVGQVPDAREYMMTLAKSYAGQ